MNAPDEGPSITPADAWTVAAPEPDAGASADELQRVQLTAERRALMLTLVRRVALHVLSSRTGIEALQHIAHGACRLTRTRFAAIAVAHPDGAGLQQTVTVGAPPDGPSATVSGEEMLAEAQRIITLGRSGRSTAADPAPPSDRLLVPIRRRRTVLGALCVVKATAEEAFPADAEGTLRALAENAAVAIHELHQITRQRSLIRALIAAQEDERRAVAYDLHDGLTQYVMASHAHLEAFRTAHAEGAEEEAREELDLAARFLRDAVLETRRVVSGLRSLALDDLGLAGALEQLLAEERNRAGWESARFTDGSGGRRFDTAIETTVYRVVQEALTNVRKHAGASDVQVSLEHFDGGRPGDARLCVTVTDDGRGFEYPAVGADYAHLGLHSMAERVELAGGTLDIRSGSGEGTTVRATVPALPAPGQEVSP
jgi:signal transduction histidine kinase